MVTIGCSVTTDDRYFVCNSRMWKSNTNKKFNIFVASTFSNGDSNNNECVITKYAMMKWAICSIEVTSVTLDWGNADILESESSLSGLKCTNYNRLHSTTFYIVNEYSFETSTTYEFAQEQTYSYSSTVGSTTGRTVTSESSTTFGGFSSTSGTEFSIGVSATSTTTVGASVEKNFETSMSAEASQSSESTSESSWERTNNRISERHSNENTKSEILGVSTSRTDSVSCVGSMMSHHQVGYHIFY